MKHIKKTNDFELFKFRQDNRVISASHVKKLINSIKKQNLLSLSPIIVNSNFEVVDGQHRLEAARELNIDIYYLIDDEFSSESMIILNTNQKKWTANDYLKYWVDHGNDHYIKFENTSKKHNWRYFTTLSILSCYSKETVEKFKKGEFIYPEDDETKKFVDFYLKFQSICIEKKTKPSWIITGNRLIEAVKRLFKCPFLNSELLLTKLENFPGKIIISDSAKGYATQFVEIYNRNSNKRLKIIFDKDRYEISK